MTAATILAVREAADDTPCRRCGQPIQRGRRVALVAGVGNVHVRCLLGHHDDHQADDTDREPAP